MPGEGTDRITDPYRRSRNEGAAVFCAYRPAPRILRDTRSGRRGALRRGRSRKDPIAEGKTTRERGEGAPAARRRARTDTGTRPVPPTPIQPQEPEASSCSR